MLILAACWGIVGLFLFFRGFLLLHDRASRKPTTPRLASALIKPDTAVSPRMTTAHAIQTHPEVIRLTSDDASASVTMSQQGKIAAALLKAGIPSPSSWNTDSAATVAIAANAKNSHALQSSKLTVTQSPAIPTTDSPGDNLEKASARKRSKNPAWMLWTGVALVVVSVYLVAAHFGWL